VARPDLRLLFDEALSPRVARALRELGFRVSHVGAESDGSPARGSSDELVLHHARSTGQVVATINLDMILLCAEEDESVLWLDPRGRQLRFEDQVVLFFQGMQRWQAQFEEIDGPVCLRVRRSRSEVLTLDEASRLARQRLKRLEARKRLRRSAPRPAPGGQTHLDL
jgi:predicted nuclease of predicted toxin-antitoxin system